MRWSGQELGVEQTDALPGLARLSNLVRSVTTPEFAGVTFHEVLAKSALNHVPGQSSMPFAWTINPYRGCSHACAYCLDPATQITMSDGRQKPLSAIAVGDEVLGTRFEGKYRTYTPSKVLAKWSTRKAAYRIRLADGTEVIASGDHRFLTNRGWKYVTGRMSGPGTRPYLTVNNSLVGFGTRGIAGAMQRSLDYKLGYLTGMIRGDAMMIRRAYARRSGGGNRISHVRLALADIEALERTERYLEAFGIDVHRFDFSPESETRRAMYAIRTSRATDYDRITELIAWPDEPHDEWRAGYLGGIFDAQGSCSQGVLRIANSDESILAAIEEALGAFDLPFVREPVRENGVAYIRLRRGPGVRNGFFAIAQPAITRKLALAGATVETISDLRIVAIEETGAERDLIDITTSTGDFIAAGVVSHNCFARPTHEYLDLDAGDDFDRQIIVKVNVGEVLRKEVAKPSWRREHVALGTNTDPYQRAEGRYSLMPDIIDALATSGTPLSILTKGTLLRRDLPLLQAAAQHVPVDLAMSIAVYDHELQQSVEPGTPSTKARLATVTAVRDAGFDCGVFMMPVLPYLTDTRAHLDEAIRQAKAAGATSVSWAALHLRGSVKPWFMQWLEREHPELEPKYRSMYYGRNAYAPKAYRAWLGERIRPLLRAHGLPTRAVDPTTGGVRSSAFRFGPKPGEPARDVPGAPAGLQVPEFAPPPDPAALF